jgi:hypothetical protein
MLPVDKVQIETLRINYINLEKASTLRNSWTNWLHSKTAKIQGEPTWQRQLTWLIMEGNGKEEWELALGSQA